MQQGNVSLLAASFTAGAAVLANRFIGINGQHAAAAANTIGVSRFDGAAGDLVTRDVLGTAIVEAGAAITAYAAIEVGADGKAVPHADGVVVARNQDAAATAAGDFIEVLLVAN
ncbi:capsid cement protein [Paraburkholderia tropica]|uniref:capsid cement protein n=1 Tax=Paraburkholderia tropica TaxID=92647 RepID=UPI00160EECCB|nr:capsid cement protein [Paraburkholderia tropica]MBB6319251.1 hypothetical protein [Paraburkholderia tropica]